MKYEELDDVPAIEPGQTLTVDDVGNARIVDRDGRAVWTRRRGDPRCSMMIVNGEEYNPVSIGFVSRRSAIDCVELAVRGWCSLPQNAMTAEEARRYRDSGGIVCACMGPPLNIEGMPCWCEMHFICSQIALGEEPLGYSQIMGRERPGGFRQDLEEIFFPEVQPGRHADGWPKGKPRPLP